jgi:hypothetical protein
VKNLLIYVNPRKDFDDESSVLIKLQIDNSLDLGWKQEDILLVTNFPYEYKGIKSVVVSDDCYCDYSPQASKINVITSLLNSNLIDNDLHWFHDIDAYQLHHLTESELEIDTADMALTDYGRMKRWSTGSIFFKNSSKDIFGLIQQIMYKHKFDEERALYILTGNDTLTVTGKFIKGHTGTENINNRVKKINISYNFQMMNVRSCIKIAIKPIRVIHFHPWRESTLDFFMYGNNKIGYKFMDDRIIRMFRLHGIG